MSILIPITVFLSILMIGVLLIGFISLFFDFDDEVRMFIATISYIGAICLLITSTIVMCKLSDYIDSKEYIEYKIRVMEEDVEKQKEKIENWGLSE